MQLPSTRRRHLSVILLALAAWLCSASAFAVPVPSSEVKDRTEPLPERLDKVDVIEHLGEALPLDVEFKDSTGKPVRLAEYFNGQQPVIVTFNYSNCPMLCSLQLNRLIDGLKQIERTAGQDFQIVTLSIDPEETPDRAAETKARYLGDYGRPEAKAGWHFLTAPEANTRRVADAVGFGYAYNEARKEWAHAAALIVATPDGKVARYLYGVDYHPETLELSLVEASDGKIASTLDRLILYCFHYDEGEGRYAPVAMNIMRVGAGLVAVVLGVFLAAYWVAESRRKRARSLSPTTAS